MDQERDTLVEAIRTDDAGFLPIVKSVLEAAGIPYSVQGEEARALLETPAELVEGGDGEPHPG